MQRAFNSVFSTLPLATLACFIPLSTQAQVTPDGTTSTTVNGDGNNFTIEQGDRIGDNLFHSFDEFSVPSMGSAVFNNAGDIANIFSRVTGSSISNIDGLLGANGTANLFLINPNGIIFGENSSLNLGGSFFASTADSLLFEGDTEFSAVNPQAPPLLEVSIPIGARFRDNPGDIAVNSLLKKSEDFTLDFLRDLRDSFGLIDSNDSEGFSVQTGKNIGLTGGNISINASNVSAPGGTISLGGLNEAGVATINEDLSVSFPENLSLSKLSLANNALVDITSEGGGGTIIVNANDIEILDGSMMTANIIGDGKGGSINITATNLTLLNSSSIATNNITIDAMGTISLAESSIQAGASTSPERGAININTADLTLAKNSLITTGNLRNSSNITIDATGTISLAESSIQAGASTSPERGAININTADLTLAKNSSITTGNLRNTNAPGDISIGYNSEANSGNITIDATGTISLEESSIQAGASSSPEGGAININTADLTLAKNSSIATGNINNLISIEARDRRFEGLEDVLQTPNIDSEDLEAINRRFEELEDVFQTPNIDSEDVLEAIDIIVEDVLEVINRRIEESEDAFQTPNMGSEDTSEIARESFDDALEARDRRIEESEDAFQTPNMGSEDTLEIPSGSFEDALEARDRGFEELEDVFETLSTDSENAFGIPDRPDTTDMDLENTVRMPNQPNLREQPIEVQENIGKIAIDATDTISLNESTIGGTIDISAADLTLAKNSSIGGEITIDATGAISLNESTIQSENSFSFRSENSFSEKVKAINISAANLTLANNSSIHTSVEFDGNAGDIFISIADSISLNKSNIFSQADTPKNTVISSGDNEGISIVQDANNNVNNVVETENNNSNIIQRGGSNIALTNDSDLLQIGGKNLAILAGGSQDSDNLLVPIPGNIDINANNIQLENNSTINADASSQNSGNIDISAKELIIIRENSAISTNADIVEASGGSINFVQILPDELITERTPGNSGNININSELLIAFPNENSDITANAFDGLGGAINITTDAILGLQISEQLTSGSDITAFSQIEPSLNGQISINTPDFDPTTGLINLPASVGDASDQISQNPCQQGVGSQFIVTGKGGLPPNPTETLNSDRITVDLVEPLLREGDEETKEQAGKPGEDSVTETVPAMGWIFNDKGEVTLTAYSNTDTERARSQQDRTSCQSSIYP